MANRHSHKKLRVEIRSRMARTGEGYQTARERILARRRADGAAVDLVPFRFFGIPMTLMTNEGSVVNFVSVVRVTPPVQSAPYSLPFTAWLSPRGVN